MAAAETAGDNGACNKSSLMANWRDLSRDARTTTYELHEHRRFRTLVSRAYYAVYSEVTHALLARGLMMPAGRGNPSHAPLPQLIGYNLTGLKDRTRWRLAGTVSQMYAFRVIADYRPEIVLNEDEARIVIGLMEQSFRLLERA